MITGAHCRAVYCIVCRCDVRDDHSEVATSTDDYLWLKLGLVTFDESEAGSRDGLTLTQLQTMLLEDFGLFLTVNFSLFVVWHIMYIQVCSVFGLTLISNHFCLVSFYCVGGVITHLIPIGIFLVASLYFRFAQCIMTPRVTYWSQEYYWVAVICC